MTVPTRRVPITTVSMVRWAAAMTGAVARTAAMSSPTANIIAGGACAAISPKWSIATGGNSTATARPAGARRRMGVHVRAGYHRPGKQDELLEGRWSNPLPFEFCQSSAAAAGELPIDWLFYGNVLGNHCDVPWLGIQQKPRNARDLDHQCWWPFLWPLRSGTDEGVSGGRAACAPLAGGARRRAAISLCRRGCRTGAPVFGAAGRNPRAPRRTKSSPDLQKFGRDSRPAQASAIDIIIASDMKSGSIAALEEEILGFGAACRFMPQVLDPRQRSFPQHHSQRIDPETGQARHAVRGGHDARQGRLVQFRPGSRHQDAPAVAARCGGGHGFRIIPADRCRRQLIRKSLYAAVRIYPQILRKKRYAERKRRDSLRGRSAASHCGS